MKEYRLWLSNNGHATSPFSTLANESAESPKNGSNQLEVQGKDIMKILSVELKSVNGSNSLYRMKSRVEIKRRYRAQGLFFAYLTEHLPIALDRYAAL